jgi:small subunit ribosomal protein S17e
LGESEIKIILEGDRLGRIRQDHIKKIANSLLEKHKSDFTSDFEHNKKQMEEFIEVNSKQVRNRIAGYITHLITLGKEK